MKKILGILLSLFVMASCKGQTENDGHKPIGGPCEDCEATLDYKILNINPKSTLTIEGFSKTDPKIKITGRAIKSDGKTPAKNVILYIYQTNRGGIYEPSENPIGWEKRHGKFRGWVKTDADGKFEFYTFRPAAYPDRREPEHIHIYVKEPGKNPYYIDNYVFDDDPMLTAKERQSIDKRGGSGIITLKNKDGIFTAHRDIILGLNIPDYD